MNNDTQIKPAHSAIQVVFDTDMGNDVDDALALALLHEMEIRRQVKVLAVTLSIRDPLAAPYIDSFNRQYGRPEIPIGDCLHGVFVGESKFLPLANERTLDGELLFPREERDYPGSTALLRKTLARAEDHSVVIIQTGFFTNLARLLETSGDGDSPLNGRELVMKKVRYVSLMAGAFKTIDGNPRYREFNVVQDIPSAQKVAAAWPTPVIWSGFEVGIAVAYPAWSIDEDLLGAQHQLLRMSYQRYLPTPHERPTWDLTSVACVAFPARGYFGLSPEGGVTVHDDGSTKFHPESGGRDRFLTVDEIQVARLRELFAAYIGTPRFHTPV